MNIPVRTTAVVTCLLAAFTVSTPASAPVSDRMGVYCIVDKVVLEPADAPKAAQVHGVCAIADQESWYFEAPARGYFYYKAPAGRESVALAEWNDLKTVAGTGQAVGFGRRYYSVGRIRPATETPAKPDEYPIHFGVVKFTGQAAPEVREVVEKIKMLRDKKDVKKVIKFRQ
jgi:hypothetical protein